MEQNEDKKPQKGASKKKTFWQPILLNLGLMGVVVLCLLWGLSSWLGSYTRHDERIEVPDLNGIIAEDAQYYVEELGLKALVVDSVYTDGRPGAVVEQSPVAGLPVKKGRIIYLTINAKTVRMIRMVDVMEWSSREAQSRLRREGFVIDSVRQVACEFDDLVLGVNQSGGGEMVAGREYPYHTHIVVRVGSTHVALEAENEETENAWME